ncbi:MAG: hypothetical protein MI862_21460 [Desulfobacterales bacterium]|nr:hypothetical protein [Desulfobacterales bacterium]
MPENKRVLVEPAPAEANPFRRAVFAMPILRAWLPLPLSGEATLEAQSMTQNFENSRTLILKSILWIFKDYKPLIFFSLISFIFFSFGLLVGIPVVVEFLKTDYITKVPSAVLSTGLMLISILSLFSGFILDTIVKHQKENFELYLNQLNL